MSSHFFLLSSRISGERLTWLEESLRFYILQIYPESLMYRADSKTPVFFFFLTGDALASLQHPETEETWSAILTYPAIRLICDRQELDLRGFSAARLAMKNPGQVIDVNGPGADHKPSFWNDVVELISRNRTSPVPETVGWFEAQSPYMHRSPWYGTQLLSAATDNRFPVELYAFLDGIHMGHNGQNPANSENIARELETIADRAAKAGLACQFFANSRCAGERGYNTWDDGKDAVISTCGIRPFKIRDLSVIAGRFRHDHIILSKDSGSIRFPKTISVPQFDRAEQSSTSPPLLILVTGAPYSTERVYGAVAFAVACAHQGILTRMVFLEDGVYALTGSRTSAPDSVGLNIIEMINAVAGNKNLHMFALSLSFQQRGVTKNADLKAVLEIGFPGLGKILFYQPGNVQAIHQRVLIV